MTVSVWLGLVAAAYAQQGVPWDTEEEDEAAPGGTTDPWALPEDPDDPAEIPATTAPADEPADEPPALPPVDVPLAGAQQPRGLRVAPLGEGSSVVVSQAFVVGGTGGTNETMLVARHGTSGWAVSVGLPFTAYRTPLGRTADLGNVQLDGWYTLSGGGSAIGLETHFRVGEPAYTWVNNSDELWPGAGADLVWQTRRVGARTILYRAGFGFHGSQGYEPYPGFYARLQLAAAIDQPIDDRFGVVGEAAFQYWDLSPFELTGMARADIVPGLRGRAGLVLPLAVWMGATPSSQKAGLRETTLLVDVSMAL